MSELLMCQDAADRLGVRHWKMAKLRKAGLLPEAVRVGRFYTIPADQIEAIKRRLIEGGHIKPRAGVTDAAR